MAESFKVSAAALHVPGGRKLGELQEVTVGVKANGELLVCSAGVSKSVGTPTGEISFTAIVPRKGMGFNAFKATLEQTNFDLKVNYGGMVFVITGTFDDATFKSIVSSGKSTGDFKFSGGVALQ
jgi:hypothetical protein